MLSIVTTTFDVNDLQGSLNLIFMLEWLVIYSVRLLEDCITQESAATRFRPGKIKLAIWRIHINKARQ